MTDGLDDRAVAALERIAAALEVIAGTRLHQPGKALPDAIGDLFVNAGDLIAVPAVYSPKYKPNSTGQWHVAIYRGGGRFDVQCAARVNTNFSLRDAKLLHLVHVGYRCGSPGCAQHYARATGG